MAEDDQSQRPAVPTPALKTTDLIHHLRPTNEAAAPDPEQVRKRNDQNAGDELGMISDLAGNAAFQWFFQEFIEKPFRAAADAMKNPNVTPEGLTAAHRDYIAFRKIRTALLEREIAHRTRLDPRDTELPALREKLSLL